MPSNFKETSIGGTSYQRCSKVIIDNPLGQLPSITFIEDKVINIEDRQITIPLNTYIEMYSDKEFNYINPKTGLPTGSLIKYSDIYGILYSLYLNLATKDKN